jgi:hypothetical protein
MFYQSKSRKGTGNLISGLIIGTLATLLVTTNKDHPTIRRTKEKLRKGASSLKSTTTSASDEVKNSVSSKVKQAKDKVIDKKEPKIDKKG